jgi:hypothetical protein
MAGLASGSLAGYGGAHARFAAHYGGPMHKTASLCTILDEK